MKLIQIVPGLGKTENALFDYATILSKELANFGVESTFNNDDIANCRAIFLNYVGYGYDKRGVPLLFYFRLRKLMKKYNIPVITFFHELYASGYKPWNSSFWLSPIQKWLYKAIYNMSAMSFCSNKKMLNQVIVETKDAGKKMYQIGMFSNIPELPEIVNYNTRKNIAIVFGTFFRRKFIYDRPSILNKFCKELSIEKIIDIGEGDFSALQLDVPVNFLGRLSPEEIANVLRGAKYGIVYYENDVLEKSGIIAAYISNLVIPVNLCIDEKKDSGEVTIICISEANVAKNKIAENANEIGFRNFEWYQSRKSSVHSQKIFQLIYPLLHKS